MRRIRSLDGLRGVAAVIVVIHHSLLVRPALANGYSSNYAAAPPIRSVDWWMIHSPLHLAWAGGEAVLVFFVLSGVVLTLPFIERRSADNDHWNSYYPRRMARLYPPVWGALAFAVLLIVVVRGVSGDNASWWVVDQRGSIGPGRIASDALLVGSPGNVISVLWSLKWEVVFSLVLPGFIVGARVSRNLPGFGVAVVLVGLVVVGAVTQSPELVYLPVFGLGVLLTQHRSAVERTCGRMNGWKWMAFGLGGNVLLLNRWFLTAVPAIDEDLRTPRAVWLTVAPASIGAAMVVVLAWHCRPIVRLLETQSSQWMGHRSYSLYLVHIPIVIAAAAWFSGWSPVSVPVVLIAAMSAALVLHRFVEVPSIRWSRRVGEWAARTAA